MIYNGCRNSALLFFGLQGQLLLLKGMLSLIEEGHWASWVWEVFCHLKLRFWEAVHETCVLGLYVPSTCNRKQDPATEPIGTAVWM